MPNSASPTRRNSSANSVNTPPSSGPSMKPARQQDHEQQRRQQRHHHAEQREGLQRHQREAGHQIEVEPHQAVAANTSIRRHGAPRGRPPPRSDCARTVGQRRDEGVHLVALVDQLHHVAAVGAHHRALVGHRDAGEPLAQPVHGPRGPAPPGDVLAVAADRADVVVAVVHRVQQQADLLGRVLQVGIERDDASPRHMLEARQDRPVLAEVAVEEDHARDVGPALELRRQQRGRAVAAAVVDEDDLVGCARAHRAPDRAARTGPAGPAPRCRPESRRSARAIVVESVLSGWSSVADCSAPRPSACAHTRSTSASRMAGNNGSVTCARRCPRRPGNRPRAQPMARNIENRCIAG